MNDLYFVNPEDAVNIISKLLLAENWRELRRYYDLSSSNISGQELESGHFFINTEQPEIAHPGGFWRYKHPFSPAFEYFYSEQVSEDKVKVWVKIEIDQGGGMIQQGNQCFTMRKSVKGYQILPD